ncbi:hypothetical protein C2G38_2122339 [Gigaspora rosea]|uniref:Uncharacterized protein n=1 Tax=Gigaspora rosea TaxID=44941 RepID=A0A397U9G0_9GLOM|nr:hypothetical protein C2G38_2122339 [Gigaspora rosea]
MKIYEPKLKPQQPSKGKLNSLSKQPPLKLDRQKPNSLSEQTSLLPQASRSSSSSLLPQASRSPSRSPLSSLPLPLISSPSLPSTSILLLPPTPPTPSVISSSWSNETYPDAPLFGGDEVKLSNGKTVRETIFPIYEQADSSIKETRHINSLEDASCMLKSWYQEDDLFSCNFELSMKNFIRKLVERIISLLGSRAFGSAHNQ